MIAALGRWVGRRLDWRSDAGQAGGVEVLPFGFLVLVVGTLIVVNLWSVIDTKMAVNAAARQGAHAVAEAESPDGAYADGRQGAELALQAYGRKTSDRSTWQFAIGGPDGAGFTWRRCAEFRVTVTFKAHLIALPWVGGAGPDRDVTSTFTEVVDPFRDTEATGTC